MSFFGPFLNTGVISSILKPDGTIPVAMERLMTCAKDFAIMIAISLRKPGGRLSGPAAFLYLSFFGLTNTSETVMGISLKAILVFVLALYRGDQIKFLNLIDSSFQAPAIFDKKGQNPLAMDFLLVVHLASMLNDRAGGSLVLVGKIVLIIFQNLFGFFSESLRTDLQCIFFVHAIQNVCCVVSCSFVHIPISV